MALDSGNNNGYMILLGKRYPVIRCNMKSVPSLPTNTNEIGIESLLSVEEVSNEATGLDQEENRGTLEENKSKQIVGDEGETTHDADGEDGFTATVVESKQSETMRKAETIVSSQQETQSTDETNEEHFVDDDGLQSGELANVDDFVNLALTVGNEGSGEEFNYDITLPNEETSELQLSEDLSEREHETDVQNVSLQEQEPQEEEETIFNIEDISQNDSNVASLGVAAEEYLPPDFDGSRSLADSPNNISGKLNILEYAKSEWKGTTYTAECLREAYQKMIQETGCRYMRQVRGDNYCALRATSFQIMSQNTKICQGNRKWQEHIRKVPERLVKVHGCSWLNQWTFAEKLHSTPTNRISIMEECLSYFIEQKQLSDAMDNNNNRQAHFSALFNSGSSAEIKIFEAIKLIMLETAVRLYNANLNGDEVPVFAWLLFARDSSENPKDFMLNHLNLVGNSGGLEQVEMCLLGQALEVTLRVFRPSSAELEDFISYYPDHMVETWDKVNLVAEDDRRYNIVVPS